MDTKRKQWRDERKAAGICSYTPGCTTALDKNVSKAFCPQHHAYLREKRRPRKTTVDLDLKTMGTGFISYVKLDKAVLKELRLSMAATQRRTGRMNKKEKETKKAELAKSQRSSAVVCAGCGRVLEIEFMQLDHRDPSGGGGKDEITNLVLLCAPCNSRKGKKLTLEGLRDANKSTGWMRDADSAERADKAAREHTSIIRRAPYRAD